MPVPFFGTLGFSYVGLCFLLCLFIPNIFWAFNQPADKINIRENRVLLVCERAGQVLVTALLPVFSDYNPQGPEPWLIWLCVAGILTALYLLFWLRYFTGKHTVRDFYGPLFGIPYPGASLPVAAAFLIGVYGQVYALCIAVLILGVGHVGIHIQHLKAYKNCASAEKAARDM